MEEKVVRTKSAVKQDIAEIEDKIAELAAGEEALFKEAVALLQNKLAELEAELVNAKEDLVEEVAGEIMEFKQGIVDRFKSYIEAFHISAETVIIALLVYFLFFKN